MSECVASTDSFYGANYTHLLILDLVEGLWQKMKIVVLKMGNNNKYLSVRGHVMAKY